MLVFCAKRTGEVTVTVYDQNCDKVETLSVSHGLGNLLLLPCRSTSLYVSEQPHIL